MIGVAMAAGGITAGGLFWLLWQLFARTPAVSPALRRLHPGAARRRSATQAWWSVWVARLWRPPARDLALLGRSHRRYAATMLVAAVAAAGLMVVVSVSVTLAGVTMPMAIPAVATIVFAAFAVWVVHQDARYRAAQARREFRRAVCSYLDMAALELASGHGPVAAVERACAHVDGWVFERLRATLLQAQLQLRTPWDDLRQLAVDIDVPELGDMGDIVAAAGADGAVVHESLLARAESLRDQVRLDALARAKATTAALDIPGAVLLLLVTAFAIYPLLARFIN